MNEATIKTINERITDLEGPHGLSYWQDREDFHREGLEEAQMRILEITREIADLRASLNGKA